jgi:hypothetical protein
MLSFKSTTTTTNTTTTITTTTTGKVGDTYVDENGAYF